MEQSQNMSLIEATPCIACPDNRRFIGEHWDEFTLINMNGRMYDPMIGRFLSPDPYVQAPDYSQNFNRYSYCLNNPLKYTDPDGEIVWMIPIVAAAVFGTGNLIAHMQRGDVDNFGDGLKYFGQGALAGAVVGTGIAAGLAVPVLGTSIKFAGIAQAGLTVTSLIGGGISHGWQGVGNAANILLSNFYLDENKSFFGGVWEGISRHTFQFIQTNIAYDVAQFSNTIGKVTDVDFWGGATFSHTNYEGGSITLGNNILLSNSDPETNMVAGPGGYTTMHEYGHYLQSQRSGFSYLFKYGIPSGFKDRDWTEHDANPGASRYFNKHYGFNWNPNYYTGSMARYSNFPTNIRLRNTKWWEWPVFPLSFLWN
jgi:RHS repeat-associated protein